ncbi:hypothetical protein ACFCVY_00050 [Streptomyces sp. NPDC056411]|uniref:hypothetical protein n=1 Tax=Streptomyces sp. NPDC056411 TaxID=3345813 RepID=UPI0035DCAF2B
MESVIGAFGARQAPTGGGRYGGGRYGGGLRREGEVCGRRGQVVTRELAEDQAERVAPQG